MQEGYKKTKIGLIPEDWGISTAEDLCERVTDGTHDSPKPSAEGYFLVTSKNLKNGQLNFIDCYKIAESDYLAINKRSKVDQYDVLYGMIGTIGNPVLIIQNDINFAIKNVGLFKTNGNIYLGKWLVYYLSSSIASKFVDRQKNGSTQNFVSLGLLRNFPVSLPPPSERQKIAEILSTVDDEIEKTDAIIKETQQLKKGLMQKLFTEGIGHTRFKETKIGKIPEVWEVVRLEKICKKLNKKFEPRHSEFNFPYIGLEHLESNTHRIIGSGQSNETLSTKTYFNENDILYGKLRPYLNKVWLADFDGVCTTEILVLRSTELLIQKYLYFILQQDKFVQYTISMTEGTSLPRVGWDDISRFRIALPPIDEQKTIVNIIDGMDKKLKNENYTIAQLKQLKIGLMQVLLTGKVRVKV